MYWPLMAPCGRSFADDSLYLLTVNVMCVLQPDGSMALDSDEGEEPSPEAMARYLSMRRHTVGVPDQR